MNEVGFLTQVAQDPDAYIAHVGEFMLASKREGQRWQVTFDIAMDQEQHPFNKYTGKATGRPGTRFKVLLVEVNDDDELVNQNHKINAKRTTGGRYDELRGDALVKESGILRNDYHFQKFLYAKLHDMDKASRNALLSELPYGLLTNIQKTKGLALKDLKVGVRFANHMVHYLCSVHSCREFKYNKNAATEFKTLRQEFIRWAGEMQRRGEL